MYGKAEINWGLYYYLSITTSWIKIVHGLYFTHFWTGLLLMIYFINKVYFEKCNS